MTATFDRRTGLLQAIHANGDPINTNFIGSPENVRGIVSGDSHLIGNVQTTVWSQTDFSPPGLDLGQTFKPSGTWQRESTGASGDVRNVSITESQISVSYGGKSSHEEGIKSFELSTSFRFDTDGALLWTARIRNPGEHTLELGEIGIPLLVNDDYQGLYQDVSAVQSLSEDLTRTKQRLIHEQRVFAHHYIGGHSSYTLVQRPMGDPLMLLVHPLEDTAFECYYRDPGSKADVLTIHSWAIRMQRSWSEPWLNGHTSLLLKPQESREYRLRFQFIHDYNAIREELSRAGNLGIRIVPAMVVQEKLPVYVEVQTQDKNLTSHALSDGITLTNRKHASGRELLTFLFEGRGQKTIQLRYGAGRWTNIQFYCTEDTGTLLDARSAFIIKRQFFQDESDPYRRNHMFLPFDYARESTFRDSDEVWEVGGSDEFGFSEPLFLVQKNMHRPSQEEIAVLETYVNDCLFRYIQNPHTYEVRASLYWKDRYPSSPWGDWTEERAGKTWRSYNYVHPANIYYGLYVIGKKYSLVNRRNPDEYLTMAYRTCLRWFTTGPWKYVGQMCGSNAVNILEALRQEGRQADYEALRREMNKCFRVFVDDPYPYSSELVIDQTAHEQVYFFTKYFGDKAKQLKTAAVIKALRGGNQPVWFRYGNDKRGDMACWYSESLNGWPLLDAFEETNDPDMFLKGYAGLMSVTANLRRDGMGFGWYVSTPGISAFDPPRTLDNGIGQFGFLSGAKAYVLADPAFGLIGAGCLVSREGGSVLVRPKDGVRKRIRFVQEKIGIEAQKGELAQVILSGNARVLTLSMTDPTGLVREAQCSINGLNAGTWEIRYGDVRKQSSSDRLQDIRVPMPHAHAVTLKQI